MLLEDRLRSLGEQRVRLRRQNAVRVHEWQRREGLAGKDDRIESCLVIEIEEACDPRETRARLGDQPELLREGRLGRRDLHVDDRKRSGVLVEQILGARVAVGGDAHEARPIEVVCDLQARAVLTVTPLGIEILIWIVVTRSRGKTPVRERRQRIERAGSGDCHEAEALLSCSLVEVEVEQHVRAVGFIPEQFDAGPVVARPERRSAGCHVPAPALGLIRPVGGNVRQQLLRERAACVDVGRPIVVVGVARPDLQFRCVRRTSREYLHDTACRIASEEGSLRPLLYLDAINAREVRHRGRPRGQVHIVDIQRHRGFVAGLPDGGTHAAQERNRGIGLTVEQEAWHAGGQGLRIRDARSLRVVGAECRDPDRNSLVRFLASVRGDDDFRRAAAPPPKRRPVEDPVCCQRRPAAGHAHRFRPTPAQPGGPIRRRTVWQPLSAAILASVGSS